MKFEFVLPYLEAGFSVIPVQENNKSPKTGFQWGTCMKERPAPETVRGWFDSPGLNLGVVLGAVSGNVHVLDIEDDEQHRRLLTSLETDQGNLAATVLRKLRTTFHVTPPGMGAHYYYADEVSLARSILASRPAPEGGSRSEVLIELRGEGGYVLAPPSVIAGYGEYRVAHGSPATIVSLTPLEREELFRHCRALSIEPVASTTVVHHPGKYGFHDLDRIALEHDYVGRTLDGLEDVSTERDGWVARCPNPNHGRDGVDTSPSLRVTIGEGGFIIMKCRAGCPCDEIYLALGIYPGELFPPRGETPAPMLIQPDDDVVQPQQEAFISEVYQAILESLPPSGAVIAEMSRRGLREPEIHQLGYRSYERPQWLRLPDFLVQAFGHELLGVPGIRRDSGGVYYLNVPAACILVPVRGPSGIIRALKCRLINAPSSGNRNRYRDMKNSLLPRPVSRTHYPLGMPKCPQVIRVTEGEIKADVSWILSGVYTIGTNGIAALSEPVDYLRNHHPDAQILLAPDAADYCKPGFVSSVADHLERYLEAGFNTTLEIWDTGLDNTIKGIDDALAARTEIEILRPGEAFDFLDYTRSQENFKIHSLFQTEQA